MAGWSLKAHNIYNNCAIILSIGHMVGKRGVRVGKAEAESSIDRDRLFSDYLFL